MDLNKHTRQASKQEDRFHCWPHMVGLIKARNNCVSKQDNNNSQALIDTYISDKSCMHLIIEKRNII